jgi:signal transduction histidine kinase/AmiR/NasT family two-component response regulator
MQTAQRVLIVEDDFLVGEKLRGILEDAGYSVVGDTASGQAAVEMTTTLRPDVVMMDLNLLEMDGLTAARHIAARCPTPIVALTAHETPKLVAEASEAGIGYYLVKPASQREVARAIQIAVARFDDMARLRRLNAALEDEIAQRERAEAALKNALAQAQRRENETRWLLAASRAVIEHHTFTGAAQRIFDVAREATGAVSGYVALMSEDGSENEVLFLEAGGLPCNVDPELPMPIRGLRAEAYAKGAVVYDNDFEHSPWAKFIPPQHVAMHNVMFAPLLIHGEAVGVMGLANKPEDFTEEDVHIAKALGDMAAIALQRVRTEDALRESETQLQQYANHLEQMVADKVRELDRERAKAIQMDKMAALGEIATGVAHELNQPLTAISFEADYLKLATRSKLANVEGMPETVTELQKVSQNIQEDLVRCRHIVDHLRTFGRSAQEPPSPIDLNEPIEDSLILTDARLRHHNVEVQLDLTDDLPPILAHPHKLEQVFLNLINNAEYAMGKQEEQAASDYQKRLAITTAVEGEHVIARVQDNGCGIAAEVQARIFDPFFTTKPQGEGTGLGLSISYDIVVSSGGEIACESVEGQGTTFTLRYPALDTTSSPAAPPADAG